MNRLTVEFDEEKIFLLESRSNPLGIVNVIRKRFQLIDQDLWMIVVQHLFEMHSMLTKIKVKLDCRPLVAIQLQIIFRSLWIRVQRDVNEQRQMICIRQEVYRDV